ncbi:ead/Ea22-like family protein [Escherichia coli]|uniref:ead/Ea22-like family protein n=1 Tax=Escherichia coli TaxID=562 RepID=UPI0019CBB602|nr:ead/Ea22-like family protein [Escherichia coli]EGB0935458.1 ead/Ea22-like family protein [Escherichia coli]MCQ6673544.1 ead/Ea22-like family protein [Escherichia coli]
MSKINYQALREIAKLATQGEWVAFISPGTDTYAVHTPGDERCGDIIKWPGFDDQKNAENNAEFIAAFNPEVVQAVLDEREAQSKRIAELETNLATLAAENESLKSNLIYWGGEDSGPVRSPLDYAHEAGLESGEEFEMQVAARMPNLTYRVVSGSLFRTEIELIGGLLPETPATDAFLAGVRAQGVEMFSEKFGGGTPLSNMVKEVAADFAAKLRKGGE